MTEIEFAGRAFCFTGKLADMKRTRAERETRARGGHTTDTVNENLDYLVIGSIASPGWKFGDFGRKIEHGRELRVRRDARPVFLSEDAFVTALAHAAPIGSGDPDGKVVVCTYSFAAVSADSFDYSGLCALLDRLSSAPATHTTVRSHAVGVFQQLFGDAHGVQVFDRSTTMIECRMARRMDLSAPTIEFVTDVERGFEQLDGVDGRLRWFEKSEGSADYIRLLREIPENRSVELA